MRRLATGVFLVLHGVVHLWYVVLSQGWVEIEDQMGWNGHSWLLSGVLSNEWILLLASVAYVVTSLGFVAGGVGYAVRQDWASQVLVGAAVLSAITIIALWDGKIELLVEKGAVGVLIDVVILASLLAFN